LKIEYGFWYISYDNGKNWKRVDRATGQDGQNGKDGMDGKDGQDGRDGTDGKDGKDGKDGTSFFKSVTQDAEYVYLTLANGTKITVPKFLALSITFSNTADTLEMAINELQKIDYQFKAATENVHIEAICSSDLTVILTNPVVTENDGVYYGEGTINIQSGSQPVSAWSKVTVFLSDDRTLLMRNYAFKEKKKNQ